jgi:hypothetical protein
MAGLREAGDQERGPPLAPREARDTGVCLVCGRAYAGRPARPRWAFSHDGRLVGSVHAAHAQQPTRDFPYWTADGELSVEAARFEVWQANVWPGPPGTDQAAGDPEEGEEAEAYRTWRARVPPDAPLPGRGSAS